MTRFVRVEAPLTALWRKRAALAFTDAELEAEGRAAVKRIDAQNTTGAGDLRSPAPESPTTLRRSKDMAATVGGSGEDVSIVGTGITHVPMVGKPEFAGLLVGEDGSAVARIEDGALCIEVGDLDMAMAWRNAWHKAVSHLVQHRERKADQR